MTTFQSVSEPNTLQMALSTEKSTARASTSPAVRYVMLSSAYVAAIILAILSLMSPNSPIARPNAFRSCDRSTASRTSRFAPPTAPLASPMRPLFSTSIATPKPRPTSPITFVAGTRTSSK